MAIDFTKPALTDNYTSAFVPNILANQQELAKLLDSGLVSITGTPPTGAKRYNRASSALEEWNGSAWVVMPLQGINFASGNIGLGLTPAFKLDVLAAAASVANFKSSASSAIIRFADSTADTGYVGSGSSLLAGLARTDFGLTAGAGGALVLGANNTAHARIDASGNLLVNRTTASGFGPLQVASGTDTLADFSSSSGSGNSLVRVRNTNAQTVGLAVQNATTGTSAADGLQLLVDSAGAGYLAQRESQPLYIEVGGGPRAMVDTSGLIVGATSRGGIGGGVDQLAVNGSLGVVSQVNAAPGTNQPFDIVNRSSGGTIRLFVDAGGTVGLSISAAGLVSANAFSGSGASLTALNASNLASGTVPNARTTASSTFGANTIVARDSNGDTAVRGLVLQNTAVAGNVLNWFEKDVSFTPVVQLGGGTPTGWTITATGRYTRIGNCVFFSFTATVSVVGAATGVVTFTPGSFPYVPASLTHFQYANLEATFAAGLGSTGLRLLMGNANIVPYIWDAATGNNVQLTHSNLPAGTVLSGHGFYFV